MRASFYSDDTLEEAAISKIAEFHAFSIPISNSTVQEVNWYEEDDDVLFLIAMEEDHGLSFSDEKKDAFLAGEISIANLLTNEEFTKEALISSPEEKAKKRIYALQHAMQIKRKAKKRRRQISQGLIRPNKRIGTAASGYTFIPAAGGNPGSHNQANFQHVGPTDLNFNPHKAPNMSVLNTTHLNKVANTQQQMPQNAMQGAAYNKQNPIAGMQGFPSMPPKPTVNTPQIKTPKIPKKINFTKVLPKPIIAG